MAAMAVEDQATALRLVHTVKSGLNYIGAETLAAAAAELEQALRKEKSPQAIEQQFQTLNRDFKMLIEQLATALGQG